MTLIKEYIETKIAGNNRSYNKTILELQCNQCGVIYKCPMVYLIRAKNSELHFCSKKCSRLSSKNGLLRAKINSSILEKYDGYYVETDEFSKKQKETFLSLYGVEKILQSSEILDKIKKTNKIKYGRETFVGSQKHKESCDFKLIAQKAWETKIKNQTFSSSKQEEKMFSILFNNFEESDIIRQVPLLNQRIDFYIKSINLYIQIDGVYWHGLNRDEEVIKEGKTSQDKKIYKQILRDRKLNDYCKNNHLKIIRFTDEDIDKKEESEIYAMLFAPMYIL